MASWVIDIKRIEPTVMWLENHISVSLRSTMDDEIVPVVTDWVFISHFLEGENVGNGFTAKPHILIKSLDVGNMRDW
jgi:hypothetical protein